MSKMKNSGVEWIGNIPEDWKLQELQWQLSEVKDNNKDGKCNNILSLTNKLGVIPYEEKGAQGNNAKDDYTQYKIAYPDTIVANSMNILIGSVGICNYLGCVSPVYYVFKPNENANLKFINYIFQTTEFQKELRRYANGILEIRLRISSHDILRRSIPLPSKEIQMKIVSAIESKTTKIETLISNEEKQIEKLKAYKQALITETVTKGLDKNVKMKDSGVEWIGEIPEHWKINKIRYLGALQNGISKSGEFFGEGFPFVSYGDVYNNISLPKIGSGLIRTTEKEQALYSVQKGDIFFTRTSETIEEVGFSSVCEYTIPNATFAGFLIRMRPFNNFLFSGYAKYYFRGNHLRDYLVKEMNLVTRASLGQTLLKNMTVLLPPIKDQEEIEKYLDTKCSYIDNLITLKKSKIEKLNSYKKSLIYEYVTGKKEA